MIDPQVTEKSPLYEMQEYTVIGVWIDERAAPVGVIEGRHAVHGGYEDEFPDGLWATYVTADDPDEAEQAAIAEMLGTLC